MADEEKKLNSTEQQESAPEEWAHFDWTEGFSSWDPELTHPAAGEESAPAEAEPLPEGEDEEEEDDEEEQSGGSGLAESILAAMFYVAGVLGISFIIATVGWKWANDLLALDKPGKTVSVTISDRDTINDVAERLRDEGLIEYPFLFKTFAGVTHKADRITTGTYELNTEMDYSALLNNIGSTSVFRETVTVTIPEGYTLAEIFRLLEENGVCSAEKLTISAEEDTFDYSFLKGVERTGAARLEGYLFPDTYEFYKGTDAKNVLNRMLLNFGDRFDTEMESELQLLGMTKDEVIRIASIIEKETTGDDRRNISSVIHNRLNDPNHDGIDGRLQMDSTVQYVLSERKEHLTNEDIAINSPYNTYVVQGLPEGPICNPGLRSIQAALLPNKTDYYYFMLGDDGQDHFFNDKDSFNAFKAAQKGE